MDKGCFVALPTPFTADFEIDEGAFQRLVEWHVQEGTDGLLICGTTGEAPTLTEEEQRRLLKIAVKVAKGKCTLLAGTGSYDTRKAVLQTRRAKEDGADGALIIFPYYNRPSFAGCQAHFEEIAKVNLPLMIYHHPGRTGLRLNASQLAELCKIEQVFAVKDSSGDIDLLSELILSTSKSVFTGDDTFALALLAAGGSGVCSTVGNLIPREWKKMIWHMLNGELFEALEIYQRYFPLCKAIFLETNPQCVKYALSLMDKCEPHLRLPLVQPADETKKRLEEILNRHWEGILR
jgi:4-hydroxy-tetrahydrodipicolinate synthase